MLLHVGYECRHDTYTHEDTFGASAESSLPFFPLAREARPVLVRNNGEGVFNQDKF